jgi:hypothetical protein
VRRRGFDHLACELSVELGQLVPRYRLWTAVSDAGWDPSRLGREDALAFCDAELPRFLAGLGLQLGERGARRLRRRVAGFDPRYPAPEEVFARL